MIRAHAGRRHARAVPRELGYRITNALLWTVFVPIAAAATAILAGPLLYQIGA